MDAFVCLRTLNELRDYVHRMLCEHDHLDPTQTPLYQATIKKSGKICGLFFQIEGPRLLKTYAIWAGDENRVLFYDSTGMRRGVARLCESPDITAVAA